MYKYCHDCFNVFNWIASVLKKLGGTGEGVFGFKGGVLKCGHWGGEARLCFFFSFLGEWLGLCFWGLFF